MRLADFLDRHAPAILAEWEVFAASLLPAANGMDAAALQDHAAEILQAIAAELRRPVVVDAPRAAGEDTGSAVSTDAESAAQTHAVLRAASGFGIRQLVAEYRSLRASVLRLWARAAPQGPTTLDDIGRFNEAIDQAIAESVDVYSSEVDRWRAVFLGVLGHDLRGPLNAVLLTSQSISAMSAGTPLTPHAERLVRSGERMRDLLDDLLDYNRSSLKLGVRVERATVDAAAVCRQELEVLQSALPMSTIDFVESGPTGGRWDPSRIRQVISNLVTNAVKYGDGDGPVRVTVTGEDHEVRLSVENTGPSIPKDVSDQLFEPLRRHASTDVHGERESLGLGLYIARQVAIAHGGDIAVESAEGRTCFTVTLPKG